MQKIFRKNIYTKNVLYELAQKFFSKKIIFI